MPQPVVNTTKSAFCARPRSRQRQCACGGLPEDKATILEGLVRFLQAPPDVTEQSDPTIQKNEVRAKLQDVVQCVGTIVGFANNHNAGMRLHRRRAMSKQNHRRPRETDHATNDVPTVGRDSLHEPQPYD